MDKDTADLLRECSSGCHMAIGSMEQVMSVAHDPELKKIIGKYKRKHNVLKDHSDELLRQSGETMKTPGSMASAFAWMSTEMKMMVNDSSHMIASVMTDGCNMGIKSISGYMNKYCGASDESRRIAGTIISAEEDFMHEMRRFM